MKIFIFFIVTFACDFLGKVVSNRDPLPYDAIFNFGDSTSDTGNYFAAKKQPMDPNSPYGSTFFKHPSGRLSDGRLIVDFIAEAYGLPYLPAYLTLTKEQNISRGVNFAFAGATAIDTNFFAKKGIKIYTPTSLSVQLDWFKKLKPSLCQNKQDCFKRSLFLVGEIGGNDIFLDPYNITAFRERVPLIIKSITKTTTALIEEGAVELVIPGNFPIGCNSGLLSIIKSKNKDDYDQFGCLKAYNAFIKYYNKQLKLSIGKLRQDNPQARIIYADYYKAVIRFFHAPEKFGFSGESKTLKACCGVREPPYNVNTEKPCGHPATTVCKNPSTRIIWDGAHYTEATYKKIAKGLVEGRFTNPPLKYAPFRYVWTDEGKERKDSGKMKQTLKTCKEGNGEGKGKKCPPFFFPLEVPK